MSMVVVEFPDHISFIVNSIIEFARRIMMQACKVDGESNIEHLWNVSGLFIPLFSDLIPHDSKLMPQSSSDIFAHLM